MQTPLFYHPATASTAAPEAALPDPSADLPGEQRDDSDAEEPNAARDQEEKQPARPLRCLITGGLGYTGAWITEHLASLGHEVYALSRLEEKVELDVPYNLIKADPAMLHPEDLAALLPQGLDCVVHSRAYDDYENTDCARKALMVNAFGTRTLLQALVLRSGRNEEQAQAGTGCRMDRDGSDSAPELELPLFICISTTHVYGKHNGAVKESTPPAPKNDFGLTHMFAEEYCRMYMRQYGLPCIILRLSNCYGAPKSLDRARWKPLLGALCRSAAKESRIVLHSNPAVLRDFLWLGDAARTVAALVRRRDLAGNTFNVASGTSRNIGRVAELVAASASRYYGRVISVDTGGQRSDSPAFRRIPELHISNTAVRNATGLQFSDRMEEEIISTLRILEQEA
ncbi:NAD(P)-dependent oxidoreductase [Desulfovibrio sp. OttesenSCG-928-A18]|nr:NAD(P)-dependent oxidoreductase [Desulfovibrio sp. OttesenSCG-928-A18]